LSFEIDFFVFNSTPHPTLSRKGRGDKLINFFKEPSPLPSPAGGEGRMEMKRF
jgi:hypothetical protein